MQDESFSDNVRNELLVDFLSFCAWMCSPLIIFGVLLKPFLRVCMPACLCVVESSGH